MLIRKTLITYSPCSSNSNSSIICRPAHLQLQYLSHHSSLPPSTSVLYAVLASCNPLSNVFSPFFSKDVNQVQASLSLSLIQNTVNFIQNQTRCFESEKTISTQAHNMDKKFVFYLEKYTFKKTCKMIRVVALIIPFPMNPFVFFIFIFKQTISDNFF